MNVQVLILVVSFILLLIMNVPISFCIGLSTLLALMSLKTLPAVDLVAQRMATGISSFAHLYVFWVDIRVSCGSSFFGWRHNDSRDESEGI